MTEKSDLLPMPKYIPYTPEGYLRAVEFLDLHSVYIPPHEDGFTTVARANNKIRRIRKAFKVFDDGVDYSA